MLEIKGMLLDFGFAVTLYLAYDLLVFQLCNIYLLSYKDSRYINICTFLGFP